MRFTSDMAASADVETDIRDSVRYLSSRAAHASIEVDPYWPKWDSPWWHLTALLELGRIRDAPEQIIAALIAAVNRHYAHVFPFRIEDVPAGYDPRMQIVCHCALGTVYQMVAAYGCDVDAELPWARAWFVRYQLPDGGLSCDEAAYVRPEPHSSVVSTLPPLEAMLWHAPRPLTEQESAFLRRGADYLSTRRLCRSARTGAVIDEGWLALRFPRFYDYDVLRGLRFLVAWADQGAAPLPSAAVAEACERLRTAFPDGRVAPGVQAWRGNVTLARQADGRWERRPASGFALLEKVGIPGRYNPWLTGQWTAAQVHLRALAERGLLTGAR
ncbi:MAG: hypothetical protein HYV63_10335 [Candidatus Schekmanbacteria bacterium]|nr:hypothetical protein [Candidatus Schekmanbacteria bacterium]